ncbi:putative AC9 transposase [Dissostichus eleginoides]|uniref:AC9 transposase n=1 Tax=Dissostichus eleginoides TaxID=100907 RepID=A0AAD9B1Q9_DISEL|nr:putative AC9 transposase [Dissostichus eleginoides]
MLESISCQYEDVQIKEATKALEASKTPTLHLTAVWLDRLKRHLQPSSTDNLAFSSLKAKCLRILVEKYEIHVLHKLAMFLHPKLKSLKLLVEEHSMETVHRKCGVFSAPPEKRARQSEGLSNVEDSSSSDECTLDEVSAYIDFKSPREENFDVLSWWKEHATRFPNVAHIARLILSIQASSAASERDFSTAGFVVSERRSQLKPGTVDDILFLHSNLKKH